MMSSLKNYELIFLEELSNFSSTLVISNFLKNFFLQQYSELSVIDVPQIQALNVLEYSNLKSSKTERVCLNMKYNHNVQ